MHPVNHLEEKYRSTSSSVHFWGMFPTNKFLVGPSPSSAGGRLLPNDRRSAAGSALKGRVSAHVRLGLRPLGLRALPGNGCRLYRGESLLSTRDAVRDADFHPP